MLKSPSADHPVLLQVFGSPANSAETDAVPLQLQRSRTRLVFAALVLLRRTSVTRSALSRLIWPDEAPPEGLARLRRALNEITTALRALGAALPLLQSDDGHVRLNPDTVRLDVDQFLDELTAVAQHTHPSAASCAACRERLTTAVKRYRGPLLDSYDGGAGEECELLLNEQRSDLERHYRRALEQLITADVAAGNWPAAAEKAGRLLAVDPYAETAVRVRLEALARDGARTEARHEFERFRRRLRDDLETEPEVATITLLARITAGQLSQPAAPAPTVQLIGRERLINRIEQQIVSGGQRLTSIVGVGGSGKTSLAQVLAQRLAPHVGGNCDTILLAEFSSAAQLWPALLRLSGVDARSSGADPQQTARLLSALVRLLILSGRHDLGLSLTARIEAIVAARQDLPPAEQHPLLGMIRIDVARICYYVTQTAHGLTCCSSAQQIATQFNHHLLLLRSHTEATRLLLVTYDLRAAAEQVAAIESLRAQTTFDPTELGYTDRALLQFYAEVGHVEAASAAAGRLLRAVSRGDRETLATAMLFDNLLKWTTGDYQRACRSFATMLAGLGAASAVGEDWTFRVIRRLADGDARIYDRAERESVRYRVPSRSTSIVSLFVALLLERLGLFEAADAAFHDALRVNYSGGGRWTRRGILACRARCALARGDRDAARADAHEGLTLSRIIGDRRSAASAELVLARLALDEDAQLADQHARSALSRLSETGVECWLAEPLALLAESALRRADHPAALQYVRRIEQLDWPHFWQIEDPVAVMLTVARVLAVTGDERRHTVVHTTAARVALIAQSLPAGEGRDAFNAIPSHRALAALTGPP